MRLLPNPYEGTHPAFPQAPLPRSTTHSISYPTLAGIVVGTSFAFTRVLFRKSYPGGVLNAIGTATAAYIPFIFVNVLSDRLSAAVDIYPLYELDGIPIPPRPFIKRTADWTMDDFAVIGAAAGLAIGLRSFSSRSLQLAQTIPRFGLRRALAGANIGGTTAALTYYAWNYSAYKKKSESKALSREIFKHASQIYHQKMRRSALPNLYSYADVGRLDVEPVIQGGRPAFQSLGDQDIAHLPPPPIISSGANQPEPQPPGSRPHVAELVNGKLHYYPTRDYVWRPQSVAEGVEILNEHIKDLNERRGHLTEQATYLWHEIAERERKYALRPLNDNTDEWIKERKALELLCSLHANLWVDISGADWAIQDSKKMLFQLQSKGTWMPEKEEGYVDPKTYVPPSILDRLREHKQATESILFRLESAMIPPDAPEAERLVAQVAENIKEVKGNDTSTKELIEEFERRRGNSGA
jgi:hypothetical protein